MNRCKNCHSEGLVKNGKPKGVQRYLCKVCGREQIDGDKRVKFENNIKKSAVIMYLEGNGLRAIARILSSVFGIKIYFQTVAKWIKQAGYIEEEEVAAMRKSTNLQKIDVVEMDELFSYIKKNKIKSEYGLLLIGTSSVYLSLK